MSFLVLAYPQIRKEDYDWVQLFRRQYDDQCKIVEPHFTLIFPVSTIPQKAFIGEIKEKAKDEKVIPFTIDRAIASGDIFDGRWHIFLIPGKGYRQLVELHDKLYSGMLTKSLKVEIPYIPHLTIGTLKEAGRCQELAEQINRSIRKFSGLINQLEIVLYQDNTIKTIDTVGLRLE